MMDAEEWGILVASIVGVFAILGALWRWVILPNLREQLFGPVHETYRQVTENRHKNREPTMIDRLDDLTTGLSEVRETVDAIGLTQAAVLRVAQRIRRLETRQGEHERWAEQERGFMRVLIESLIHDDNRKGKPHDKPRDT